MRRAAVPIVLLVALTVGCSAATPEASPVESAGERSPITAEDARELDARIEAIIDDAEGYEVGVAIADLPDGDTRVLGDGAPFFAASTAKVLTAAAFYHLVETGEKSLDEPLGAYDAASHIEAMINESNNDSWLLLMQSIGYPELIEYATSIGVVYDPEENLLTAADMARVLEELSRGELLDPAHTEQLLGFMQDTNNENLIPAGVDPGISVHHKYGQIDGYLHDAALLDYGGHAEALVIYTNRTGAESQTDQVELIHELASEVGDVLVTSAARDQ
jgi:beta-lactamase class A